VEDRKAQGTDGVNSGREAMTRQILEIYVTGQC